MSQTTTGLPSSQGNTISNIVETLSSFFIQREQLRAGYPLGFSNTPNTPDQFPKVTTGVDSNGATLQVPGQWVQGVSNTNVLAGVGMLAALGIVAYALTR